MTQPEDEKYFKVNLEKVSKTKGYLSTTRLLAYRMLENPYITVEDFLLDISDSDLKELLYKVDEEDVEEIILLSEMLATGEGLEYSKTDSVMLERTNILVGFLTIESLARKGLVKVYRENMSFGDDFASKIIVEKM
jgi:hypothetical protein